MILIIFLSILHLTQIHFISGANSDQNYECKQGYCVQTEQTSSDATTLSLAECTLLCLDTAAIWPKPTGNVVVKNLSKVNIDNISVQYKPLSNSKVSNLVKKTAENFGNYIKKRMPCKSFLKPKGPVGDDVVVNLEIVNDSVSQLSFGVDESYVLTSHTENGTIHVNVKADTYYGARHGMETLSQLFVYDDVRSRAVFPRYIELTDKPAFFWRGLALDTSRNYVTPKAIKRTLDAMAASKMNIFHWHMTDTASFPYESTSRPELSQFGAYKPNKIYNNLTIMQIIDYANQRGIKVVPELDAPAHVGEGWQHTGVLTCFGWTPWQSYCVEPPCGQLDPSRPEVYDILEDIYGDMLNQFGTDVFHMGGDEVNVDCWNNTANLTNWMIEEKGWELTTHNFQTKVWPHFQTEAAKRLYRKAGKEIPLILWSSDLTASDNVTEILPPQKYIIQVWSEGGDDATQRLLEQNYSIILSNYDALYLDCGFSGWVTDGNNWCSPYKGWQLIYENKPENIAGNRTNQVLGGEAVLWNEQGDSSNIDSRLWPRAAAFAETLWTAPKTNWTDAEQRMLIHRERLVSMGVDADALQPEWCLKNQQYCPLGGKFNI